jgi:glycosyltransferase involved in cell wall biosynthesis
MANGTPVIAFDRGSVPEIIEDGLTGFIVDDVDSAAQAIRFVSELDRDAIRRRFEERFTAERMARDYLALYQRLLHGTTAAIEPKLITFADAGDLSQAAD